MNTGLRFRLVCAGLALAATSCAARAAEVVGIRAPVACNDAPSCGSDITLAQAQASYADYTRRARHGAGPAPAALTESHLCNGAAPTGAYVWAPAHKLRDGPAALRRLLARAASGAPSDGHMVVASHAGTAQEQHLALCSVASVAGVAGPPRACATVALLTPGQAWLRSDDAQRLSCPRSASFRNSGAIDLHYNVSSGADAGRFGQALLQAIASRFGLAVEQEIARGEQGQLYSIYIRGAGTLGNSKTLGGGWREALDFDGVIQPRGERELSVRGTVHALVCRQALGEIVQYSGLDNAQQAAYAAAFDASIAAAIELAGKGCKRMDASTIDCD